MKRWGALAAAVLILVPAFMAWAEPDELSNTNSATYTVFDEDQDLFLSPTDFGRIGAPSIFLQFDMPGSSASRFRGGLGLPLGAIYAAAHYLGSNYVQGNLGSNQSTTTYKTDTYSTNPITGQIVGVTKTTTTELDYQDSIVDNLQALVGLRLGPATLGIYSYTAVNDFLAHGNYRLSYAMPGSALWSTVGFSGAGASGIATSFATTDSGGVVTGTQSQAFATGQDGSSGFTQNLVAGFAMPLSSARLEATAGVKLYRNTTVGIGAYEAFSTRPNAGYASFTPATALPGAAAAAIADATSYTFDEGRRDFSYTTITPSIGASVELPLPLPGNAVLTAGGTASAVFAAYSSPYMDLAAAEQPNRGVSTWFHSFGYTTSVLAPGQVATTGTSTRAFDLATTSRDASVTIEPDVKLVFAPSDRFSFGIRYRPQLYFGSWAQSVSGSSVRVVTYEDGDGVDGNAFATTSIADPDDYVETTTVSRDATGTQSTRVRFSNYVYTGAQFYLVPARLRVNLGARVANYMVNRTTTVYTTDSVVTYTTQRTTDGVTAVTAQSFDTTPAPQASTQAVSGSTTVYYVGGLTFFFSENLVLDLYNTTPASVGGGVTSGNIWDLQTWDLELNIRL